MTGGDGRLTACLEKLEAAIDPAWERDKLARWRRFLNFEPVEGGIDLVGQGDPRQPLDWPDVGVNEAIASPDKMLLQQLAGVYRAVLRRSHEALNIRTNYGTGILPSLFGADIFWMDDALNTLPTTRPLEGDHVIDRLLEAGVPNLEAGFGARVFETAAYFRQRLAPYPKTAEAVWLYHPDLQGPIDVVELLLGSRLFLALVDEPDKVLALTALVTETYCRFLHRWLQENPPRGDGAVMAHWGRFFKGQVMLRDDSVVNLSPAMYRQFVKPFDEQVLARFGGGGIHFCGRGDHVIELMTDSPWLTAVQLSQPHLNDMEKVYRATVGRGIVLDAGDLSALRHLDLRRGVIGR